MRLTHSPRLIARRGVILDTKLVRSLGLTWARRPTGEYAMTKRGWEDAEDAKAVASASMFGEAARRIALDDGDDWACCVLDRVNGLYGTRRDSVACDYFTALLRPSDVPAFSGWYGSSFDPLDRLARTLGLLLCAELVRDGFTPEGWSV